VSKHEVSREDSLTIQLLIERHRTGEAKAELLRVQQATIAEEVLRLVGNAAGREVAAGTKWGLTGTTIEVENAEPKVKPRVLQMPKQT